MIQVKKPLYTILLTLTTLALLVSCASKPAVLAPEPGPAPVVVPAPSEPVAPAAPVIDQGELDKLLADAQALKKKAFDLKLFEVLPDDYKAANALFDKGKKAYDDKDSAAAKEGLGAAVASYTDLISRGVNEIAAAKRKDADDMKASAVKASADSSQSERFGAGTEANDEESIPGFELSRLYYELAWKRAVASSLRDDITDKDFAKWDSGNFQLADTKFQAEDGFWASEKPEDRAAGTDALDESILRFNLVIQKGREMLASTVKDKTDVVKQRSEEIKANVAVKDMYEAALNLYNEGSSQLAAKEYEDAASAFDRSGAAFEEAYQAAAEKRATAEAEMKAADEATSESQRKAEEADPLLPSASR